MWSRSPGSWRGCIACSSRRWMSAEVPSGGLSPAPPVLRVPDAPAPEFQPVSAPPLSEVLLRDDTLPLDPVVLQYWIKDLQNPLRQGVLPLVRIVASLQLYVVYFLKRILP